MDSNNNNDHDIRTSHGRWLLRKQRWAKARKDWRWHVEHHFWWFVHNTIAHPLMGIIPTKKTMQFHDWTGDKLNGKSLTNTQPEMEIDEHPDQAALTKEEYDKNLKKFIKDNSFERFM